MGLETSLLGWCDPGYAPNPEIHKMVDADDYVEIQEYSEASFGMLIDDG